MYESNSMKIHSELEIARAKIDSAGSEEEKE